MTERKSEVRVAHYQADPDEDGARTQLRVFLPSGMLAQYVDRFSMKEPDGNYRIRARLVWLDAPNVLKLLFTDYRFGEGKRQPGNRFHEEDGNETTSYISFQTKSMLEGLAQFGATDARNHELEDDGIVVYLGDPSDDYVHRNVQRGSGHAGPNGPVGADLPPPVGRIIGSDQVPGYVDVFDEDQLPAGIGEQPCATRLEQFRSAMELLQEQTLALYEAGFRVSIKFKNGRPSACIEPGALAALVRRCRTNMTLEE